MIFSSSLEIKELVPVLDTRYPESVILREQVLMRPIGIRYNENISVLDAQSRHFAAFLEADLVGIVLMLPQGDPQKWRLRQMAVRPDVQRMGIGRSLVGFAEQWARDQSIDEIILHARVSALDFYLRLGYRVQGEVFEEVGIDHRLMTKRLIGEDDRFPL